MAVVARSGEQTRTSRRGVWMLAVAPIAATLLVVGAAFAADADRRHRPLRSTGAVYRLFAHVIHRTRSRPIPSVLSITRKSAGAFFQLGVFRPCFPRAEPIAMYDG